MKKRIFLLALSISLFPFKSINATYENTGASIVINADTREIISGENYKTTMGMASTTKIMTAIIAIENASASDVFTVSLNAQNQEGSSVYLRAGQSITLKELLYALMLNSGNDAAMTIAENVGGSMEDFVVMMNEKALEIGCTNTNFENPSGLPSDKHYSTAYDMALIMAYAMENDFFMEIISQKEYQLHCENSITYLKNHNKLLWQYPHCIGGKTGYTKDSGRCLVTCSEKDDKRVVCVTLNDKNDWQNHINFSESAFDKIKNVTIIEKYDIITTKKINNIPVNLLAKEDITLSLMNKSKRNLLCRIELDSISNEDIKVGDEIGVANIYYKGYNIATVIVLSGRNIKSQPENVFGENFNYILEQFLLKKQGY